METNDKGDLPRQGKRIKTPQRKPRIDQDLTAEKIKLLQHIFDTLCSVRLTAKSYDYGFLSYLVEMAALEVQKEIKQEKLGRQRLPEISNERYSAPNMPLKAGR